MTITTTDVLAGHGLPSLPSVIVESYNLDVRQGRQILNHKLRKARFFELIEERRARLKESGADPLGDVPSSKMGRKALEKLLSPGKTPAARLIRETINEFASDMAEVLGAFLRTKEWSKVERIAVGGGFRKGVLGERAITRAAMQLSAEGFAVDLVPIRHHADDAALIGAGHLLPAWALKGHNAMLAVDIGGTNLRVGVVSLNLDASADLADAEVWDSDIWRHADDGPKRTRTVERLVEMLKRFIADAEEAGLDLVPIIGIGCPGVIDPDGSIVHGAVNLPGGNWESEHFNLAAAVMKAIDSIGGHRALVLMHNDAVLQGLSQIPWMKDVNRWGVITIGTGLGNASFTNRKD